MFIKSNKKEGKETCDVAPTLSRLGDNPAASRNCRTVIFYLSKVVAIKIPSPSCGK